MGGSIGMRLRELRETRTLRELLQTALRVGPMVVRGLWVRVRVRESAGLLLVGRGVAVRNPQHVRLGRGVVLEDHAEVQGLSREGVQLGDGVTVGRLAMVRPSGYYGREPGVGLRVGSGSNIGPYCYVGCSGGITIGENVMMGPHVGLYAEDHVIDRTDLTLKEQGVRRAPIVIEDDCWLASGCTITAGVRVGRGSVVAAGAVVTRDVPPFSIVGGVPAAVLGRRQETGDRLAEAER